jgi:hypothetical protein
MKKEYESKRHIEDVTQVEVSAAIRYLDPDLTSTNAPVYDTGVALHRSSAYRTSLHGLHLAIPLKAPDCLRRFENAIDW